ncbi:TRAP transporter large permease subunit [Oricola thermophila]|uniref:TRAP transporter large permease subunit n=1 Tax=Oricola thermophila TaxID=2742145 RepID=A0A6N1VCE8_9HYPH|nr:TRAP transporter large permease subunit [Oricola thermophila]QKV18544.1 TRAP transporter large permease subunit [Oricola thermophila]
MTSSSGIGLCTPSAGAVLFVGRAAGQTTATRTIRTTWPFHPASVGTLLLVTFVPALSLWLPSIMR